MELLVRLDTAPLADASVVVGFPGPGLVGGIVVEELVETLGLSPIGSLGSPALPAQAVVELGRPYWPVLFFAGDGVVAVKVEADLDGARAHLFARSFVGLLAEHGARRLVVVDGLAGSDGDGDGKSHVYAATSDPETGRRAAASQIPFLEEGAIGGAAGASILWAEEAGLPAVAVAATARPHLPDAFAAATVVSALGRFLGLNVDARRLEEKGEKLEEAWMSIIQDAQGGAEPGAGMYS